MKVGILHHDLEWVEERMAKKLKELHFDVSLLDIRSVSQKELEGFDCIINRIYASVANRDCPSNVKVLRLLKNLEEKGIQCINSFTATFSDYSKYYAYEKMKSYDVTTPKTFKIISLEEQKDEIMQFISQIGLPLILKRDMGGRGKDVMKINSTEEAFAQLKHIFSIENQYNQGYILQEFIKNNKGYDCRIAIIDGAFAFSYKRSLISTDSTKEIWLASVSRGSLQGNYSPSEEEISLAKKATIAIGALFNEVDMTFTKNGPVIIENNPTPNYSKDNDSDVTMLDEAIQLIAIKIKEKIYA